MSFFVPVRRILLILVLAGCASAASAQQAARTRLSIAGLERPVEVLRDHWGIAHIYAATEHDLFFTQGYLAARDRLFQLEVWRRQATGTVAEILGPRELRRDIGARLFRFRGDLEAELRHYHPRGPAIIGAFVEGINARISEVAADTAQWPIELRLLGVAPKAWTPDVVISRHQGLLGNIDEELRVGRAVTRIGAERVKFLSAFGPGDPLLELDTAIVPERLFDDILGTYRAFRTAVRFSPDDVAPWARAAAGGAFGPALIDSVNRRDLGSNNWVVSGRLTQHGFPIMANDPHRALAAPSLRHWVHLVGPGWNVIGGGEPSLPGVSIGHNEHGAWGLTIFETDGEDLYVYRTDPRNPERYWYRGAWVAMRGIADTIRVKGAATAVVRHRYTRHGPVVYLDSANHLAYAVRAAWMETGGAPYLASLRMDQARTWEEFREACTWSHIPGENMVWADTSGTIGWQAVGIAPIRRRWSGLVPVPGDGRYEWDGYLPIRDLPHAANPPDGFIATANNDLIPRGYAHTEGVGFSWSDPFRWARVAEELGSGRRHAMADMMRLQTDYLSIPARTLVPLLAGLRAGEEGTESARRALLAWDYRLDPASVAAGIYAGWERELRSDMARRLVPEAARPHLGAPALSRIIDWMLAPPGELGPEPLAVRDSIALGALSRAIATLTQQLGPDRSAWRYGQPAYKHVVLRHPLGGVVADSLRTLFEVGPAPRGGSAYTVNQTGNGNLQTSGASFRIIVDTRDWDASVGMNTPGQSGDPRSPYYRNLFDLWATDQFFPLAYSRTRVETVTAERLELRPR
ncbi:MAG TPA: penicillin acylase family protein [Gemmatimonadaceae bacterium]|nr:penicillin acylase family protein [Gemmatimonadaceae bacterium]